MTDLFANPISDTNQYIVRMKKAMNEKLFFTEYLADDPSIDHIVDFGCADGSLLKEMKKQGIAWDMVGIDANEAFKPLFEAQNSKATWITDTYPYAKGLVNTTKTVLNLSSVIHEVYNYNTPESIKLFWDIVFGSGYKYIVIRDMITTDDKTEAVPIMDLMKLKQNPDVKEQLHDFEKVYGPILTRKQMYHFLMKYRYKDNWNHELNENYLPLTLNELLAIIPDTYNIVYKNVYTNEFIKQHVYEDFGINLNQPTHMQLILKRATEGEYEYVYTHSEEEIEQE